MSVTTLTNYHSDRYRPISTVNVAITIQATPSAFCIDGDNIKNYASDDKTDSFRTVLYCCNSSSDSGDNRSSALANNDI